jgi:DNA-binding response OmpR family regulator
MKRAPHLASPDHETFDDSLGPAPRPRPPHGARPRDTWQLRILLAEDDRQNAPMLGETFRQDGHKVVEVRDGSSLLDHVASTILDGRRAPFDLIVSEGSACPGVTGLSVLGGLRESDWSTPFLLIVGVRDAALEGEARRLGASVLAKPIELAALRRFVNGDDLRTGTC